MIPTRMQSRFFVCAVLALAPCFAFSQEKKPTPDPEVEKHSKSLSGFTRLSGWMRLYRKQDDLRLELMPEDFGQLFFAQATLHTGISADAQAGDPLGSYEIETLSWERRGDSVRLIKPNLAFRFTPGGELSTASQRSFPQAILASLRIMAEHPQTGSLVVDPEPLFDGQLFGLQELLNTATGGGWIPDRGVRDISGISAGGDVLALRRLMHFRKTSAGGPSIFELLGLSAPNHLADRRSLPLEVSYKLWPHRETGYVPRFGDPRVGYFTSDYFNADRFSEFKRTTKLINRFHLVKKDPTARLSEPVEPIVWVLDPSIPEKYKAAVTEGILLWNKAFESAGFLNAMRVEDAPDDPDYDHASGRWNVVRWTMSPDSVYAVAQMRMNPITGQIMSAGVTVDAGYPRAMEFEQREDVQASAIASLLRTEPAKPAHHDHRKCLAQQGKADSLALGWSLLPAEASQADRDQYVHAAIVDLIAHEIGHCLGLRHNFAASGNLSVAELTDRSRTSTQGIAASVMDYTPVNVAALLSGSGDYWNPVVGPYDHWAIRYGYEDVAGTTPEGEQSSLAQIARQSGLPGHIYLTDEDADGLNPLASRWDLGSDPLEWMNLSLKAAERLQAFALRDGARQGESYERRTGLLTRAMRERFRSARFALRMVGGVEYRRMLRGDIGEEPTLAPAPAAEQRAAMDHLARAVLRPDALTLPISARLSLTGDPDAGGAMEYAPILMRAMNDQVGILSSLISAGRYDQIVENMAKGSPYTLAEHFDRLNAAVFADLNPQSALAPHRRELQAFLVEGWSRQSESASGALSRDARLLARSHLTQILQRCHSASVNPDLTTRLHAQDLARAIELLLDEDDS